MINFFFRTYGCQANVADSQALAKYLTELGCREVHTEADSDLAIINTCAIRDKAEQKLYSYLGEQAPLKKQKPYMAFGVIGCVASYRKDEIYKRFDHVKFVYGARDEFPELQAYLNDLVVQLETTKQLYESNKSFTTHQDRDVKKVVKLKGLLTRPRFGGAKINLKKKNVSYTDDGLIVKTNEVKKSFINIMTGCNKYCAYCIVPFTRGREISFPMTEIVEKVKKDVEQGAKEVTLIGQNVNSYVDPETGSLFHVLLEKVAQIPGEFWIRYVSPHPQDMTVELFDIMAQYRPKVTAWVHFPLQSGSNKILKDMRRNYTIETFLKQVGWLRDRMPDAVISTDIIVGFPGETEEEFEQTMQALEAIKFDWMYSFIFSKRKYTRAFAMEDDCPQAIKTRRLMKLQKREKEISLERNSRWIGKTLKCLVEKRLENGKLLARTEGNVRVAFDGTDDCIGQFKDLLIESVTPAQLRAVLLEAQKVHEIQMAA